MPASDLERWKYLLGAHASCQLRTRTAKHRRRITSCIAFESDLSYCNLHLFAPVQPALTLMGEQETARCFYTAMRTEINQHLLIVNQVYTLYLGGTAALFAGALHKEGNHNLLTLIPYLTLGDVNILGSHERAIGSVAAYCAQELEDSLNKNGRAVTQWDRSKNIRKIKDSHYASYRVGGLTIVVFPGIAALCLAVFFIYSSLRISPPVHSVLWIKVIAACVGAL